MSKTKKRIFHFIITIALIAMGAFGMVKLTASKPQIEKRKPTAMMPMVRVMEIKIGPQPILIRGEGVVRPLQEIILMPQVGGKVVYVSQSMVNGGQFRKGDTLLLIDQEDYKLAVTLAEAKVRDSESKLKMVEEESAAAREEWYLHSGVDSEADKNPPPLVVKEPQLAAARARLEADGANLRKALLNLERTELKTPFNGRVSQENVDIGQYVSPGQALATLYSTDVAEVIIPLEDENLSWFHVPGFTPGKGPGSPVVVRARVAGRDLTWSGIVVRTEGKLDERTRMINVVVRVKNPYAKKPPLAVGLFVNVYIKGRILPDAAVIPRAALREGDTVWVVEQNGRLRFRKVETARVQGDDAIIKAGLKEGDVVVISALKAVTEGMSVSTLMVKEGETP